MLTDALEMHFIDMVKWRKITKPDLERPLHRWMVYFDERSPAELVEEVVKMDGAIQVTEEMMAKIMRDPALLHAYDMFELTRIDYKLGMQGARLEGERKGRRKIARNMKADGEPSEKITRYTGLSAEEIAKLGPL
jgi:predicted transposase/invertase (TIGR01784 family)